MRTRLLDLDEGVARQSRLIHRTGASVVPLTDWGPHIRVTCRHRAFRRFEADLAARIADTPEPTLTFLGSGDFHHISLALLRDLNRPVNVLVLDNHPDWMRGVPILHCGTWLYHAARLPHINRIFHVGGDVDFDNGYRWLAPWPMLRSGKITVFPARRTFQGRGWRNVPHESIRSHSDEPASIDRLRDLMWPYRFELASLPLYISFDKDVMPASEAVINWDSGHLSAREAFDVLTLFREASGGLAGMDVVGDWSSVRAAGLLRRMLIHMEHPPEIDRTEEADRVNEAFNLRVIDWLERRTLRRRAA
jgi:arginase family enzyme